MAAERVTARVGVRGRRAADARDRARVRHRDALRLRGPARERAGRTSRRRRPLPARGTAGSPDGLAGVGLQILEDAGVRDLVEFYAEESQIVLPRLLAEGRRFDLAFLDGNHRFEGVFLDLVYSGRLLGEGGIVFVDDTHVAGVRKAVDFCAANLGWVVEDEGAEGDAHAWTVLRTGPADAFRRPFTEFVDF